MEQVTTNTQKQAQPKERFDLRQTVTDIIIKQLEAGTVPWEKPWTGSDSNIMKFPKNSSTGKTYEGVNIVLLWGAALENGYQANEWATLKQWSKQNEIIRQEELKKGKMIVYYDITEKEIDGEIKKFPFLKYSRVFNKEQLESYSPSKELEKQTQEIKPLFERLKLVDQFIENTKITIELSTYEACYIPSEDKILIPCPEHFIDTYQCTAQESYYSTLTHEMIHLSGHEKRLNRDFGKKFGDQKYAVEELVAELGSAFLCAELEITTPGRKNHAGYIAHWLKVLRDDKQYIFSAASAASKAVDYFKGFQPK